MTEFFSRRDQRHGGMDGRTALYQYLVDEYQVRRRGIHQRRHLVAPSSPLPPRRCTSPAG
ncbi:hypothetical protein LT493_11390 [Streptomyces tricolor]|nr:hypothetical protein [Streptomyces tricolor]